MKDIKSSFGKIQEPARTLVLQTFQTHGIRQVLLQNLHDVREAMAQLSTDDDARLVKHYNRCQWQIEFLNGFMQLCDKIDEINKKEIQNEVP